MDDLGKMKILSILEGAFHEHVENNGKMIRYPITFDNNLEIRGKGTLGIDETSSKVFYSGRYKFGANSLFIYQAIDSLLGKLDELGVLNTFALEDLVAEYQAEDE